MSLTIDIVYPLPRQKVNSFPSTILESNFSIPCNRSRPFALWCWIAMLRRERAVCEGNNGANLSGAPSPPAVSNNAASLNSCIRPSAITSPDGLRLHCFHQVRERLRIWNIRLPVTMRIAAVLIGVRGGPPAMFGSNITGKMASCS